MRYTMILVGIILGFFFTGACIANDAYSSGNVSGGIEILLLFATLSVFMIILTIWTHVPMEEVP